MKCVCYEDPPSLFLYKWTDSFRDFVNKCVKKDVKERWSVKELMSVSACIEIDG